MSLADITHDLSSNPDDHAPIIRHLARHDTQYGGWDEWSVACICGKLYETTTTKWFIPSKPSCERLYKAHLIDAGIRDPDEILFGRDDSPETELDMEDVEQVIGKVLVDVLQMLVPHLGERSAFTTVKGVLMKLESECQS